MKYYFVILFFSLKSNLYSQLDCYLYDSIDNVMFRSLLWDGVSYYYKNDQLLNYCKKNEKTTLYLSSKFNVGRNVCDFEVAIKSLKFENGEEYKLLHFKTNDGFSTYFRLYGFMENDFIHFYNRILKQFLQKRKITGYLENWQKQDSTFNSVDFKELIKAVEGSNNRVPSMISHSLKSHLSVLPTILSPNALYIYRELYMTDNIYAYFSNRPLEGKLTYNIPYKKRIRIFKKQACDCF